MKTIWKFPLEIEPEQEVSLPPDAVVLAVKMQGEALCMWALVDPNTTERRKRWFAVRGTGHLIHGELGEYLGTVQQRGGELVWHVFEIP